MKLHSIILFFAIIIAPSIKSQNIILHSDALTKDLSWSEKHSAQLILSPIHGGGWKLDVKIDSASKRFQDGVILFPVEGISINFSKDSLDLILSNNRNEELIVGFEKDKVFGFEGINGFIQIKGCGSYIINHIRLPYKNLNIIDGFHKLVKQILKPYTQKSATCDNSIIGLINSSLGIDWGDSWRTPFDEFIPVAERFYGSYDSLYGFMAKEYNPYTRAYKQNFSIDICGQRVNSISFRDAYLHLDLRENRHDKTKYIKSTQYSVYLDTPKAFKKDPKSNKKEECIWNKDLALDYCSKIKQELDLLDCNMQKVKSKCICEYKGMKNGKNITLNLRKVTGEYTDFFCVSLSIANKTIDNDFYIVWD